MKTRLLILALSFGLLPSAFALNTNVNKIRVTHIKFDYKGGHAAKGDGLNIRKSFGEDLVHEGNGVGWGEWIRSGVDVEKGNAPRNEPALWVAKDTVKISVRFEAQSLGAANISAKPKDGKLKNVRSRMVNFAVKNGTKPEPKDKWTSESQGDNGAPAEWCLFDLDGDTGDTIAKLEDQWVWFYTDDKGGEKKFDSSGKHVVYRVIGDGPFPPWFGTGDHRHPWVDALEFSIRKAKTEGISVPFEAIKRLTLFIHAEYGLKYDTKDGAPYYFAGPEMELSGFIRKTSKLVNCHDCAAALTATSSLLGVEPLYYYQPKFGYIKATALIGVGNCNNPFFKDRQYVSKKLVPEDDYYEKIVDGKHGRSYFRNHGFVVDSNSHTVFDACVGPHLGTEDVIAYHGNAIDASSADPVADAAKKLRQGSSGAIISFPIDLK